MLITEQYAKLHCVERISGDTSYVALLSYKRITHSCPTRSGLKGFMPTKIVIRAGDKAILKCIHELYLLVYVLINN